MRLALAFFSITAADPVAVSATSREPVRDEQVNVVVEAIRQQDPTLLRNAVGERVVLVHAVGSYERTSPEALLEALRQCELNRVQRFDRDPDAFVLWSCPEMEWTGSDRESPGYLTVITNHPLGLSVSYNPEGIFRGPLRAPAALVPVGK